MCACGIRNQCVLIYPCSHARVHCPVAPPLTETKCSGGDVDTMQVHEDDIQVQDEDDDSIAVQALKQVHGGNQVGAGREPEGSHDADVSFW